MKRNPLAAKQAERISDKLVRLAKQDDDAFTFSIGDEEFAIQIKPTNNKTPAPSK